MRLWRVVVDIREAATGYAYPVVRHTFYGQTKAEAQRYFRSHMKSDAFMRDCIESGKFGPVTCRASLRIIPPS